MTDSRKAENSKTSTVMRSRTSTQANRQEKNLIKQIAISSTFTKHIHSMAQLVLWLAKKKKKTTSKYDRSFFFVHFFKDFRGKREKILHYRLFSALSTHPARNEQTTWNTSIKKKLVFLLTMTKRSKS